MGRAQRGSRIRRLGALVLAVWVPGSAVAETIVSHAVSDGTSISADGQAIGALHEDGGRTRLEAGTTRARLERSEEPLVPGTAFPSYVEVRGELADDRSGVAARVLEQYELLAPAAPIDVEGLGLVVPDEDPDVNAREHDQLRAWLGEVGLPPDTGIYEDLHRRDTGRALRVWYEIAGRRVGGSLRLGAAAEPAARFDSAFHVTDEGWKIHHARELFYHRQSLEMVDTVTDLRSAPPAALRSYHCGCYGWAIGGDWVTVGEDRLYHVLVEWRHHRVGAGFFLGLQPTEVFPWVRLADRDRVSRLARRASAYRLTDAAGETFAEIAIGLDPDPPPLRLGPQSYVVRVADGEGGLTRLAEIHVEPGRIEIRLAADDPGSASALDRLDALFAAMPTQMLRGDGVRDSHLGRVETLVDWVRLIRSPREDALADVVSEVDAATALAKVHSLLGPDAKRFAIERSDYRPLPPRRRAGGAGSFPQVRAGDS